MNRIGFLLEPFADTVEGLWRRLERHGECSFFLSWSWVGTWLACLPGELAPVLLIASNDGGPIAAAVLVSQSRRLRGVLKVRQWHLNSTGKPSLDSIWIEHNGFVGDRAAVSEIWPAFLAWFAQQPEVDEIIVPRADEGIGPKPLSGALLLREVTSAPAFRSPLSTSGIESILAQTSSNTRQQLRRSLRACEELGELRCEAASSVEVALDWFEALKAFHVDSWERRGKPHAFRYPFWETFHRALIARGVPEGSVRLLRISAGNLPLGYLYNFRRGGTVYAYQSGFDGRLEALRPGYVSHLLAMAASAAEGANCYDFLAGDNQLKRSLGSQRYAICSHSFAKPALGLRLETAARSLKKRLVR